MGFMSVIIPLLIMLVFGSVIGVFVYVYRRKETRHPVEQGKTPLYSETCGGMIGAMRYSLPFMRLTVYEDAVVIGGLKTLAFSFGDIAKIETGRFRLSQGIRIHHTRGDIPERIVVWTGSGERIKTLLEEKVPFV